MGISYVKCENNDNQSVQKLKSDFVTLYDIIILNNQGGFSYEQNHLS